MVATASHVSRQMRSLVAVDDHRRLHHRTRRRDDTVCRFKLAASRKLIEGVCEVGDLPGDVVRLARMSHQRALHLPGLHPHAVVGCPPWPRLQASVPLPHFITVLTFQYANLYEIRTSWKTLAYSIKLKLKFEILYELVEFRTRGFSAQGRSGSRHITGSGDGVATILGSAQEIAAAHTSDSRFSNAAYARMDEHSLRDLPL
jgi:hypothetical protein